MWVAALATALPEAVCGEGVPIVFSGRDGQPVRFDYGRRDAFVPPEMKESRFERPSDSALIPLVDRSVTPNSGRGRRMINGERPDRDWIFRNPQEAEARTGENRDEPGGRDDDRETAMMRYLRGEAAEGEHSETAEGSAPDEARANGREDKQARDDNRLQFRRDINRGITGREAERPSLLSRIEGDAGFRPADPGMTLKNFFQAEQRRENESQHREKMTEFRQLLANPFGAPSGGSGFPTDGVLPREGGAGVSISTGLPGFGNAASQPGISGIGFGPRAGLPNAFDTPKVPVEFSRTKSFEERKPEPIRRQMSLDIPKRDF